MGRVRNIPKQIPNLDLVISTHLSMATLENDFLKVEISTKGAQLTSVNNKATQIAHLRQGDPQIWGYHAPNLFPVVGQLINYELLVDGQAYPLSRHGFARTSEFFLLENDEVNAVYSLPNCENTLKVYPYKFDFQVLYTLIDNALRITYKLINHDSKTIYFSVGAHPAFNIPFNAGERYED